MPLSFILDQILTFSLYDEKGCRCSHGIQNFDRGWWTYFISIHCNSYKDDLSVKGFECYYYQSSESERLAETITVSADGHSISTRKVKEENYAVLRETAIPSVLIEVGFLTNKEDRGKLLSPEYQEILSEAIASDILNYDDTFWQKAGGTPWSQKNGYCVLFAEIKPITRCGRILYCWISPYTVLTVSRKRLLRYNNK